MTLADIKRAYQARQKELYEAENHTRIAAFYSDDQQDLNRQTISRVMEWASAAPETICRIVELRVLHLKSWADISMELFQSEEPNTAYMRLKRYMAREDPDP